MATLLLSGDIMLGGQFLELREQENLDFKYPFQNMTSLGRNDDLILANLESPLSKRGTPRLDKNSILFAPMDAVEALRTLKVDVVCLGNNHITDYGPEGLEGTVRILEDTDFAHFGAGTNLARARRGVTLERGGIRFSFLGYTTDEPHVKSILATDQSAGCVPYDMDVIREDISRIRPKSDLVCVSLHWGYEYHEYPSPAQIELAHQVIDAGAHLVIGTHPHVVQGIEKYRQGVIFYSLGNFFFPDFTYKTGSVHRWPPECRRSIVAKCAISQWGVEDIEVIPVVMEDDYRVRVLTGQEKVAFLQHMDSLSEAIPKEDFGTFWSSYHHNIEFKRSVQSNMSQIKKILEMDFLTLFRKATLRRGWSLILRIANVLILGFRLAVRRAP